MQHIKAIHLNKWTSPAEEIINIEVRCDICEFGAKGREHLEEHSKEYHKDPTEELLIEGFGNDDEGPLCIEEISKNTEDQEGHIQERDCPTPIPESVYICAECSTGFSTNEEIEKHMREFHQEETLQEIIIRLECELRIEKGQHEDHLDMLKDTLKDTSMKRIQIETLEKEKKEKEEEIENLKKGNDSIDLLHEIMCS